MDIDLKKLVRISDFKQEDKKKILDNFDSLSGDAILELWQLCLENLQWKVEIEISKRVHEGIFNGVITQKDTTNYKDLEHDILLHIFTTAEVEVRNEEIENVRNMIKKLDVKPHNILNPAPATPLKN